MVLARFLPKDEQFFDHFAEAATNALEAARLLAEVVENGPETDRKVRRLRELEHQGDEITHRIFQALNSTFVTPLDREDIRDLAAAIDDFVDDLEEVGKRLHLYRLGAVTEPARRFAQILVEQAEAIEGALRHLEYAAKRSSELKAAVLELHRAENEADEVLINALAGLYDGAAAIPDLVKCIRWGELYGLLEDATDRAEDIGDILEGILIKYA